MPDRSMFRAHRERFLAALEREGCAALIPTATPKIRSHDTEYPFRPDSDFWYLTGFGEPDCALVLLPRAPGRERGESVLFLREKKREEEVWSGKRLGVERAAAVLGVERAFPIAELWTRLPELLRGCRRLVYRTGLDEPRDRALLGVLARMRAQARAPQGAPSEIVDVAPLLHELRLFKSEEELARMRRAAAITAEAHAAAMRAAAPGGRENEIDALLHFTFRRLGASGPAYPNIVACGANACVLHYHDNDGELRAGELLLVDAGAEVEGYAADVTRTFPVSGRFSAPQRALYEVVLRAQRTAMLAVRPGSSVQAVHDASVRELSAGLVDLGLLKAPPEGAGADEAGKRFYVHRTSHWLGLDVHDCGAYVQGGAARILEPGMVLTVEPGLYVAEDDLEVEPRWRGTGIRIEDDLLVTPGGHEVLTAEIPREALEVEAACGPPPSLPPPSPQGEPAPEGSAPRAPLAQGGGRAAPGW